MYYTFRGCVIYAYCDVVVFDGGVGGWNTASSLSYCHFCLSSSRFPRNLQVHSQVFAYVMGCLLGMVVCDNVIFICQQYQANYYPVIGHSYSARCFLQQCFYTINPQEEAVTGVKNGSKYPNFLILCIDYIYTIYNIYYIIFWQRGLKILKYNFADFIS